MTFTCSDATSGIASCSQPDSTGEGRGQSVTGTATDNAGNSSSLTVGGINVDLTPPSIFATARTADGAPYVAGTWTNQSVTVRFGCADALSGIQRCGSDAVFATEGDGQSASGVAVDYADNRTSISFGSIRIDLTPPVVTYTGNTSPYAVDQEILISCVASDALSGVASTSCADVTGPAYSFPIGTTTYTASATDRAGNVGAGSTSVTVEVTYAGLCALTQRFSTSAGVAGSLCSKLTVAAQDAARGDTAGAQRLLSAYRDQVAAQSGRAFSTQQAAVLISLSRYL